MNNSSSPLTKTDNILPVQTVHRTCPHCGSSYLDRVQRRTIDKAIGMFVPLKRYHCASCGWQGNLKASRD